LREFLEWVQDHSQSVVLVTSRAAEAWLGQVRRIAVSGLNRAEAAQYATHLLAAYPAAQGRREYRSFGDLLDWLNGHPLSMRLTLSRLETSGPAELLADLEGASPLPGEDAGQGRLSSLGACVSYSFAHLSEQARRLLPAVSLFYGIADEDTLTDFSAMPEVPTRFTGVSKQQWRVVLEDAVGVGLLTRLVEGIHQIHPALPGYLTAGWHAEDPVGYREEREACEQALCMAYVAFSRWLTGQTQSGNAAAYAIIGLQRRTLGAMLGYALDHRAWAEAESIIRALDAYWDTRGFGEEAAAWADRILDVTVSPGQDWPLVGGPAWNLRMYSTTQQANRQLMAGQPDLAEQTYRHALAHLQDQPESEGSSPKSPSSTTSSASLPKPRDG
jgi:hypothetical protein